jgi:hypothetical protein
MRTTFGFFTVGAAMLAATACAPTGSASIDTTAATAALGTNGVPNPVPTILRSAPAGPTLHGWIRRSEPDSQALIYVAAYNQILIFPEQGSNQHAIGSITDGVSGAYGLYVDGNGNLYVANSTTITAYHPNSLHPFIAYKDPASPLYVAKDYAGHIYGANRNGTVTEFLPSRTAGFRTYKTPGVEADGINIDVSGNMYVAYRDSSGAGSIKKFQPNSQNGHILGMKLVEPQGLQLDKAGNILVVETGSKQVIDVFPPGKRTPSEVVQAGDGVTQVVLQEANNALYVSNFRTNDVYVSAYPRGQFEVKDATGTGGVQGMALSNEER